jgi:hypothetical protein
MRRICYELRGKNPFPLVWKGFAMNIPSSLQGESLKRLLQGIALGFVFATAVGFNWFGSGFGWTLGSTAEKMARERARAEVIAVLAPLCVENFRQSATPEVSLAELKKIGTNYTRQAYIEKAHWDVMAGSKDAIYGVSAACADALNKL